MRYVTAYRKSPSFRTFFRILRVFIVLVPLVVIIGSFMKPGRVGNGEHAQTISLALTVLGGVAMTVLMQVFYRNIMALEVDVHEQGIQHLAPGKQRTLLWKDLVEARIVPYSRMEQAMRVRTAGARYLFKPDLVPDSPDAPELKMGFLRTDWIYPDGRREPADAEHSFGTQLVRQYRPDLLIQKPKP